MPHELGKRMVATLLDEVRRRKIGEHRDPKQLQCAVSPAADGRVERLAIERMHRQERCPAPGDRCGRALDGRLDVEQLGIDEYGTAVACQLLRQLEPAGKQKLEPDLVDANAVAERLDKSFRLFEGWHVERHDEAVAGEHQANFPAATAGASTT